MAASRSRSGIPGPLRLPLLLLMRNLIDGGPKLDVEGLLTGRASNSKSIVAGSTLTLNCTLNQMDLPGKAEWHKRLRGSTLKAIYSESKQFSSRVARIVPGSTTDFSIRISNVLTEDAGTYICLSTKFVAEKGGSNEKGETKVSVIARPSQPLLRGPPGRVTVGSRASFNCSTEGFSSREITVLWLKDGTRIEDAQTRILGSADDQSNSYRVESVVEVLLGRGDVRSQLTCQIHHSSLEAPLQQDFQLGSILRVRPKVRVDTSPPSPVKMNATVMVTCKAEHFYPDDAKVQLSTANPSRKGQARPGVAHSDGTFSLTHFMEVTATQDLNSSLFTCLVKHHSKPVIKATATLFIRTAEVESSQKRSILGLCLGIFLNKVAIALFLLCLFQINDRECSVARYFSRSSQEVTQC